jgi:hypothetical protein
MTPNDVTNTDASAMPDKDFLERFPVSPNTHGPAKKIAHGQKASNKEITASSSTIVGRHNAG